MLTWSLTALVSLRLGQRYGFRAIALIGCLALAAALLVLSTIGPGSTANSLIVPMLLAGLGAGMIMPNMQLLSQNSLSDRDQGLAGGLFVSAQQTGAAVGLAALAAIAASHTAHTHGSMTVGYRLSFLLATGVALLALALVAVQMRRSEGQERLARRRLESGSSQPLNTAEAGVRRA